ncbi:MAG: hypothetical protein A2736_00205 [Candidatus Yanofskybacteria bacterium RIFCSPHIGHO2_01_FULL_41_27]|uniref:Uncharacterized protein n=1 Tax=Candidatus Yanofskybacteria bacterium RIFCSPHIGHO2_01_FULL_41_27 TaxID=1802662 RepID=A0A1F8EFQ7_9BACT|nr:MAG: hypothetical protein A2736_00205 [Candidatus Yanofskybacteria bacterium RIFCSPHIGHO2_01_FULL_41_27]OGN09755.1 MAG: hypothetical protein A3C64_00610 [Candidatus Yanofskybacteria bacterium RIFCSPHIGHO2_02_FULL_41_12]OGN20759.1 MAG: hypothetical protein A3B00_01015 [Candidatus Yanofskybacteria bacterium RIFCSPLOWO2_01_FULL_41_33]
MTKKALKAYVVIDIARDPFCTIKRGVEDMSRTLKHSASSATVIRKAIRIAILKCGGVKRLMNMNNETLHRNFFQKLSVIMEQFGIACVDFDWGLTGADENSFSVAYYRHGKIREERFKANL